MSKISVALAELPEDLVLFEWEAYLIGFLLLVVRFYLDADVWMIDPGVLALKSWQAIAISVTSLAVGWFVYDGLCHSPVGGGKTARGIAPLLSHSSILRMVETTIRASSGRFSGGRSVTAE